MSKRIVWVEWAIGQTGGNVQVKVSTLAEARACGKLVDEKYRDVLERCDESLDLPVFRRVDDPESLVMFVPAEHHTGDVSGGARQAKP